MLLYSFAALFVAAYVLPLLFLSIKWRIEPIYSIHDDKSSPDESTLISVVIAVRNEEVNIESLIHSLNEQTLSKANYEVLIVNDNSTDSTLEKLTKAKTQHQWLKVIQQKEGIIGKKAALNLGLHNAKAELIAFTDGDCIPCTTWLETLWDFYLKKNKPDMIIGLVDMSYQNTLQNIFRLEFLSMLTVSSAMAAAGLPALCNGANLAVKKDLANAIGQNSKSVSGDDVFLLHSIKRMGGKIRILKSNLHKVFTPTPIDFSAFIKQRIRWGSKAKYYTDITTIALTSIIVFANIALLIALVNLFIGREYLPFLFILCTKLIADASILCSEPKVLKPGKIILLLPLLEIIYAIYLVSAALLSIKNPFEWKGQKYQS